MLYLTLTNVIFVSKAHSHTSNSKGASHFAPYMNQFIVTRTFRNSESIELNVLQNDSMIRIIAA